MTLPSETLPYEHDSNGMILVQPWIQLSTYKILNLVPTRVPVHVDLNLDTKFSNTKFNNIQL
jgi:hypothetical protein